MVGKFWKAHWGSPGCTLVGKLTEAAGTRDGGEERGHAGTPPKCPHHLPAASATTSQMLVAVPTAVTLSKAQRGCSSTKVLPVIWPLTSCRWVRVGLYGSSSAMKTR